jgi:hypothetical protein
LANGQHCVNTPGASQFYFGATKGKTTAGLPENWALPRTQSGRGAGRWVSDFKSLVDFEKGANGQGVSDFELLQEMLKSLDDLPRSGAPKRITLAQEQQIVALACEKPTDYGVEMTNWTLEMLAKVAIARCIIETISPQYVGEILKKVQVATA